MEGARHDLRLRSDTSELEFKCRAHECTVKRSPASTIPAISRTLKNSEANHPDIGSRYFHGREVDGFRFPNRYLPLAPSSSAMRSRRPSLKNRSALCNPPDPRTGSFRLAASARASVSSDKSRCEIRRHVGRK